jgi:hypothetical protein
VRASKLARGKLREWAVPEMSLPNIVAGLVFSGFGFVVFTYGKRMGYWIPMFCGIALMMLPLFVDDMALLVTSAALGAIAIIFRHS